MSDEWPYVTVADCAANEPYSTQIGPFGDKIRAETYTAAGAPVLRGTNVNTSERFFDDGFVFIGDELAATEFSNFLCRSGDVILCHKGTLGKIGIIPKKTRFENYVMGNSMMRVRCDPQKLSPLYLYYWLCSQEGQNYLLSRVSQVGVPQIQRPLTTLREARFRLPPLPTQHAIVGVLGLLDDKIELNRRMNANIDAMARALFRSWFVDFDPVRAKIAGRASSALRADAEKLFPRELASSDDGDVPVGWQRSTFAELAELNPESWTSKSRPRTIDYVDLANTKRGRIEAITRYSEGDAPSRAQRILRPGDTIVGTVRPGNESFALVSQSGLTGSTGFAVLRPRRSEARAIVYLGATASDTISTLAHLADGGAYPAVRSEVVAQQPVVIPPVPILAAFEDAVGPLLERCAHCERECRTLVELRDLLLPKLMSGELRIRDAERAIEAVA